MGLFSLLWLLLILGIAAIAVLVVMPAFGYTQVQDALRRFWLHGYVQTAWGVLHDACCACWRLIGRAWGTTSGVDPKAVVEAQVRGAVLPAGQVDPNDENRAMIMTLGKLRELSTASRAPLSDPLTGPRTRAWASRMQKASFECFVAVGSTKREGLGRMIATVIINADRLAADAGIDLAAAIRAATDKPEAGGTDDEG